LLSIFTVDVDGRPLIAFNASGMEEAQGIAALSEFRSDLEELTSRGLRICSHTSCIAVRSATDAEISAFQSALEGASASDAATFVFLVEIDGVLLSVIVPQDFAPGS
jgi:hypothetical protein